MKSGLMSLEGNVKPLFLFVVLQDSCVCNEGIDG